MTEEPGGPGEAAVLWIQRAGDPRELAEPHTARVGICPGGMMARTGYLGENRFRGSWCHQPVCNWAQECLGRKHGGSEETAFFTWLV